MLACSVDLQRWENERRLLTITFQRLCGSAPGSENNNKRGFANKMVVVVVHRQANKYENGFLHFQHLRLPVRECNRHNDIVTLQYHI